MTAPLIPPTCALLALGLAAAAAAQTPSPSAARAVGGASAPAAEVASPAAPVNDQAAQDRIMALVRARKCGPAKTEATRVGDLSLAEQIDAMCGARSLNPFPTKSGGGAGSRRGSGAGGSGR